MTDKYLIKADEIAKLAGTDKVHFLNDNAKRINKSLGDMTGLTGLGFHIISVPPGCESTEYHVHYFEDETKTQTSVQVISSAIVLTDCPIP